MTKQEWLDSQTPKVRREFKNNCNRLNVALMLKDWLKIHEPLETCGISGAFVWKESPQGHQYWYEINRKIKEELKK